MSVLFNMVATKHMKCDTWTIARGVEELNLKILFPMNLLA